MVQLVINLTPTLTGVLGTLYLISGETIHRIIDLPPSVDGFISFGVAVSNPNRDFTIIFPEQTIEDITYAEAASESFNLLTNVLVNVTLTPKAVTPPTISGLGLLVAIVAGVFFLSKKKKK